MGEYGFQVTQSAGIVTEYNQPVMFVVRPPDPLFTDYIANVYGWNSAGVISPKGFTITAYPAA